MESISNFINSIAWNELFVPNFEYSLLFIAILFLVHLALIRWFSLARFNGDEDLRLRKLTSIRRILYAILFFGLLYIWAHELHSFVLSIVGVALAIVIATKELIMCLLGTFLRLGSKAFEVGDRIEIAGFRGDVIKASLLSTTLLEVGKYSLNQQHTGKWITFPNSLLLNNSLLNESNSENVTMGQVKVPLKKEENWQRAQSILLAMAEKESAQFSAKLKRRWQNFEQREGNSNQAKTPVPTISLSFSEKDGYFIDVILHFPTLVSYRGKSEQSIISGFLQEFKQPIADS